MNIYLRLLHAFFRIGIEGDETLSDPPVDNAPPADDPNLELDLGATDDEPPARVDGDEPPARVDTRASELEAARAEAREARARAERAERDAEDIRRRNLQASNDAEARQRAEEDRILSDPQADANEKWRIQANRRIRETENTARMTAFQSQDSADRSAFSVKCSTNKRLAYVEKQVEEEIQKMRANGQNAPREAVAYFLLGKMAANAKTKAAPKTNSASPRGGQTAGARSDVSGKTSLTEREKRRARLENQPI